MGKGFRFLLFTLILAIVAVPTACGGPGNSPPPVTPPATSVAGNPAGGNQSPVVKSLTANPASVKQDEITELRCDVTDPDGDPLTFAWSSNGGVFSDSTNKQFWTNWRAPKQDGTFNLTVTVSDGRGGTATKTITLVIGSNRPPTISSATIVPPNPKPGDTCTITVTASDPDGDPIKSYTWLSSNSKVTSSGNNIGTWVAPDKDGVYEIQVVVSDGKDNGQTTYPIKITVLTPSGSTTLTQLPGESGTVVQSSELSADYRAGDDANNNGLKAYFSFDLTSLKGANINSVKISFPLKQTVGAPFSITPPFLYIEPVYYGPRALKGADYEMPASGAVIAKLDSQTPGEYDVTGPVSDAVSSGRYQIRIRLGGNTNSNKQADYLEFTGGTLKIIFQK
jgi:hypothetical protein